MNFRTGRAALPEIFAGIDANEGRRDAPAIYLSSIDVNDYFDGLHEANHVDLGDAQADRKHLDRDPHADRGAQ